MGGSIPGWVGPTVAISLVVIALSFAAIGVAGFLAAMTARRKIEALAALIESHRRDIERVLDAVRRVTERATDEAQHYLRAGRVIREDLEDGVRRVKHRLRELEALYDVVHEEVEDTALDVAARVRAVRQGSSMVGRLRRWMVRSRR